MNEKIEVVTIRSSGSIFWNGREWKPKRGTEEITLPLAAVEHIESHHYTPQNQRIGTKLLPGHRVVFERIEPGGAQ
jgi:hypothetical protein